MSQALKTVTREAVDALQDVLPRIARGVAGQSKRAKKKISEMAEQIRLKDAELARGVRRHDVPPRDRTEVDVNVRDFNNRRYDPDEFDGQVNEQLEALQNTSMADWIRNRGDYVDNGRSSASLRAQRERREIALRDEIARLRREGQSRSDAIANAEDWMSSQAALHRLDGIAGGNQTDVPRVGDSGVNSSLGSQWRSRVGAIDDAVVQFVQDNPGVDLSTVFMNITLI